MSLHSPPGAGVFNYSISTEHVQKVIMDTDYETARLMLDQKSAATLAARKNQFLSYPVKGRSLAQLQGDYRELSEGRTKEEKKWLEESYLTGWSYHDTEGVFDWVAENIDDNARKKRIYGRVLATDADRVLDLMFSRHGKVDYDTMMSAIAENRGSLTEGQIERFLKSNQSRPATEIVLLSAAGKGWIRTSPVTTSVSGFKPILQQIPERVLVIPRP